MPRLHDRFFACDGDAMFFAIVASPARGENRMYSHPLTKSLILSQKIQLIKFLAIFFCDCFICRITRARLATHAIFTTRWRRDNLKKKIASPSQSKNRSCSQGLMLCLLWFCFTTLSDWLRKTHATFSTNQT